MPPVTDRVWSAGAARLARVAGVTAALGVFLFLGRSLGGYVPVFAGWVHELGAWGPIVFIVGYAVSVVLLVPAVLLTLAGGAVFGLVRGTLYVFLAAVVGSIAAFVVARYVARGVVEKRLGSNPRVAAIDRAVAAQGLRIVFLLRLSPVFPFVLLNYALGLTRVRLIDYALASFGMIPGTILYVYYGKLAGDVAAIGSGQALPRGTAYYLLTVVGLVATVVVTTLVTRIARRAVREATAERNSEIA